MAGQFIGENNDITFIHGEVVHTKAGAKFVEGETILTADGLKFVAGFMINEIFIPGGRFVICLVQYFSFEMIKGWRCMFLTKVLENAQKRDSKRGSANPF